MLATKPHLPGEVDICNFQSKHVKISSYPKMGECGCASHPQSRSGRRPPFPQMGVSGMQRMPMQYDRRPPQARSSSPPTMSRTVPPQYRKGRCPSPELLERSMVPHSAHRNLKATTRSPDFARLGSTMEELSKLEFVEMQNIEEDLRDFHLKRRKLVYNITSINLSKAKKSIKKAVSKMGL